LGRQEELTDLGRLLDDPGCRMVTILGPGGVGKTRLALQVGETKRETLLEGVHFVPLAAQRPDDFLVSAFADSLQLSLSGTGDPQTQLVNYLSRREVLLILDSFEHLLAAGAKAKGMQLLGEILENGPEVKVLVTSRERLNLRWETCFEIAGLDYPGETASEVDLDDYAAVQLFLQAARQVRQDLVLSKQDMSAVVRVCQLVEGLPLGIELAASWAGTHTYQEIADEIGRGLDFLATSLRDTPQRHRSIQATFEHSWSLLTLPEQNALGALSVFRRGFQRQAAEEVTGATPAILRSLVEKSLLRCLPSGRCEMHRLVQQYAAEKLSAHPAMETRARDRHCTHYIAFVREQEHDLKGKRASEAAAAIKREIANVRSAWGWAINGTRLDDIARSLDGLSGYYALVGPFPQGETLIRRALDCVHALVDQQEEPKRETWVLLSRLLAQQARFFSRQGMNREAIAAAQAAIRQAQACQEAGPEATSRLLWGRSLRRQGDYASAQRQLEIAAEIAQRKGLHPVHAESLGELGILFARHENIAKAKGHFVESLRISRELGDRQGVERTLGNLGLFVYGQDDLAKARAYHEQALETFRELGAQRDETIAMIHLGLIANQQGDYASASIYYEQALCTSREIGDRHSECSTLSNLGLLAHRQSDYENGKVFSEQALEMARDLRARRLQGFALTHLGHNLAGLGRLTEAADAYQEAIGTRRELARHDLTVESLAGLARTSLALGDLARAQEQVDEILTHVETGSLEGAIEPWWVYLTCYRVLKAGDDPRAQEILAEGHRLLHEQAAKISDDDMRRSFLENVTVHQEIVAAFESQSSEPGQTSAEP
jgi:predicted ATPase